MTNNLDVLESYVKNAILELSCEGHSEFSQIQFIGVTEEKIKVEDTYEIQARVLLKFPNEELANHQVYKLVEKLESWEVDKQFEIVTFVSVEGK